MKLCLLHTAPHLAAMFDGLLREHQPDVTAFHMVDESLLRDTIAHGLLPRTRRRVASYAANAVESGAEAVLVTCSSIGEAAEGARALVDVPVYRVDAPMAAEAVAAGQRIGVLATLSSTLGPTQRLIEREAAAQGVARTVLTSVCDGAFAALRSGRADEHDAMIRAEAARLAAQTEVLVLAQASMARLIDTMPPGEVPVPVLSSPASGVRQVSAETAKAVD
ncbi:MAG: aspartate/glutamate racemase family protein [Micromonosporaceae bacterium]